MSPVLPVRSGPSELGLGKCPHCFLCEVSAGSTWIDHLFSLGDSSLSQVPPLCFQPAGIRTGLKCSVLQAEKKKVALDALRESKTKTLNPLHQQKLALKGSKPGPNCVERMIAFEVLSRFLSIKHLSLKGYCLTSGCRNNSGSN